MLDLDLSINNGIISSKIDDKRDDFDFAIVHYPHLDGDTPRGTSYGVYIFTLTGFTFHFTNCAPLVRDLFLYCYERDFMLSLKSDTQADIIEAFNNTSRYLDDIFNIDNPFFDTLFPFIYPKELCLNKTNESNISAPFLDLDLSISNGIISSKIYDKRDDFNFDIVNYQHLDGDVPRAISYGVYISQLIRFARACSSVEDFHIRNRTITEKLLKQGYRYNKLRNTFSKFCYRNLPLIIKM